MTSICVYLDQLIDPQTTRLILYPDDSQVEIDVNAWYLSPGPEDTPADLEKIEAKLRQLATAWTTRFAGKKCRTNHALFYCWYDEQALQLRVCLSSIENPQAHFGATVARVDSPRPILQRLLAEPDALDWDQLEEVTDDEDDEDEPSYILPVWAVSHTW